MNDYSDKMDINFSPVLADADKSFCEFLTFFFFFGHDYGMLNFLGQGLNL